MKRRACRALVWLLLAAILVVGCGCRAQDTPFCVTVIDVGQGDSTLLSQEGVHMLIDTGAAFAADALLCELDARRVRRLEYLVLTHPHEDHIGNARRLLMELDVAVLVVATEETDDFGYGLVLDTARERGCEIRTVSAGDILPLGEASCRVLAAGGPHEDANDSSIVLRVDFVATSWLFMGDVTKRMEERLMARSPELLDCDFLRLAHHGSAESNSPAFLSAVLPHIAAVSCGAGNMYGFPQKSVMQNLAELGVTVLRTDRDGTLVLTSDGTHIQVATPKGGEGR